ncbi:hypothetical protein T01_10240 [Trichinella spiralis]|uniref:Uncharacterized protein n=1 Tax=Trichinella spiralis TaxID=6334 RepID=A0A0V1BWG8_TRISP|nr:hypothetical protein T01_10240 [Trichinella spiralis]
MVSARTSVCNHYLKLLKLIKVEEVTRRAKNKSREAGALETKRNNKENNFITFKSISNASLQINDKMKIDCMLNNLLTTYMMTPDLFENS